jgi:methyl-accepting chemotaxis protein
MDRMGTLIFFGSLLFLGVGGVISYFVARHITVPLQEAVGHLAMVALGDLKQDVPPVFMARRDEIGKLAVAVRNMLDSLREKAAAAERIAAGDLNVKLEMKSNQDILTKNLNKMVANLRRVIQDINMLAERRRNALKQAEWRGGGPAVAIHEYAVDDYEAANGDYQGEGIFIEYRPGHGGRQ